MCDSIFCTDSLHHLPEAGEVCTEMRAKRDTPVTTEASMVSRASMDATYAVVSRPAQPTLE
jgi:hypothetical protein